MPSYVVYTHAWVEATNLLYIYKPLSVQEAIGVLFVVAVVYQKPSIRRVVKEPSKLLFLLYFSNILTVFIHSNIVCC